MPLRAERSAHCHVYEILTRFEQNHGKSFKSGLSIVILLLLLRGGRGQSGSRGAVTKGALLPLFFLCDPSLACYIVTAGTFIIERTPGNGFPETIADSLTGSQYVLEQSYNGFGELIACDSKWNTDFAFAWNLPELDKIGRIKEKTEVTGGAIYTYDYSYDSMGRLKQVRKESVLVEDYDYDLNGNRTHDKRNDAQRWFEYGGSDGALQAIYADEYKNQVLLEFTHDSDGFLAMSFDPAADARTLYTYARTGELLRVKKQERTDPSARWRAIQTIEYLYDPMSHRIAKKVDGTVTEKYLWACQTSLLAVYSGSDRLRNNEKVLSTVFNLNFTGLRADIDIGTNIIFGKRN